MPEFEITAEYADGRRHTSVVSASTWVDAWRDIGVSGPEDETARISVRSLGEDVDVEIVTSGVRYRLRSRALKGPGSDEIAVQFRSPRQEATTDRIGIDTAAYEDTAHGSIDALAERVAAAQTKGRRKTEDFVAEPGSRQGPRPENKRKIQSTTEDNPAAAEAITARVTAPANLTRKSAPMQETRVSSPATDPRELPQLFTPMAEFGGGATPQSSGGKDRGAVISWAVETVWRQVPSRLVLGLMILGRDATVTHARGEGARLLLGARARLDEWPSAVVLRAPSRMRFGPNSLTLWFRGTDGSRHPVEVRSAIWTPLDADKDSTREGSMRTVVIAIDAPRPSGFTEGEMSAFGYLSQMVAARLA